MTKNAAEAAPATDKLEATPRYHTFRYVTTDGKDGVIFDDCPDGSKAKDHLLNFEGYRLALFTRCDRGEEA